MAVVKVEVEAAVLAKVQVENPLLHREHAVPVVAAARAARAANRVAEDDDLTIAAVARSVS